MPVPSSILAPSDSLAPSQMNDLLLIAQSNKPGSSAVTLINVPVDTGYGILDGADWGIDSWDKVYSGARGTQGARMAGATSQNRQIQIPLQIIGASHDDLETKLSVLWRLDAELRRFGGRITFRPKNGSFKVYYDVLDCSISAPTFGRLYHHNNIAQVTLAPVCSPYLEGPPMDIADGFDTDTSGDYVKDADGALLTVKGGQLVPGQVGTSRWRHTGVGYSYGDVQATVKITTGSTVASYSADVFINGDTAGIQSFFSAQLQGGNLNIAKWVAGVNTWPATTAFAYAANSTYWLRIRREGRLMTASVYTSEPTPLASPAATVSYTMTIGEVWAFPFGHSGLRIAVVATGERYDDFRVEPYTYATSLLIPDERALRPLVVGDAPPLTDLVVTQAGATTAPIWALAGWWERPSVWNYIPNGDFEDDVDGWSVAAVAGVVGAATSITRNTTAARNKYGGANGQVVCPATANTGASFKINRRFYQGRSYVATVWASSAAGTTISASLLGVSGDLGTSPAPFPLTTTPTCYTTFWTPTADRDGAYVGFQISAATGTTLNIDGVVVCEARSATHTAIVNAGDTSCTLTHVPDDWATPPFLAIFNPGASSAEIVRVESIATDGTNVAQLTRGLEGTTAASQSLLSPLAPLPAIRSHLEGKGAQPPVGVIDAESADPGNLFTWTVQASGTTRLGNWLYATGIGAAGSAAADWLVDPHLLVPDDYTQGELAVEVWGRFGINTAIAMTAPTVILSLAPENATVASGVLTSNFGAIRYSEEFGPAGKRLVQPTAETGKFCRLGTVRFPVDAANPLRSRLQVRVTWTAATAGTIGLDYLVLVPANQRALSPSGKANDANFPKFISSTAETTKTVRSDLSGLVAKPPAAPHPDHGLGGSLLELPPGNIDWVLKLGTAVPDDPTVDVSSDYYQYPAGVAHLAITPRFSLVRSS